MPDVRLPIKIKRIPGGYTVNLADGSKLWIYGGCDKGDGNQTALFEFSARG